MLKKWKIKRFSSNVFSYAKTTITFPHLWVAAVIMILTIVTFLLSKHFNDIKDSYTTSVFSNIFTGLITGFVLTILIGTKNVYQTIIQAKCDWLTKAHEVIHEFISLERELWNYKKMSDEDFFNKAYDAGCKANYLNELVLHSQFDKVKWFKPESYFKRYYKYDAMERAKEYGDLHILVSNYGEDSRYREDIIKVFNSTKKKMHGLDRSIIEDIERYKVRLNILAKSII